MESNNLHLVVFQCKFLIELDHFELLYQNMHADESYWFQQNSQLYKDRFPDRHLDQSKMEQSLLEHY